MIKKISVLFVFLFAAAAVFAQVREDTLIHVLPVIASVEQASFFKENFDMEIEGAGYSITQTAGEADYLLQLEVRPNMILYDDGTTEQAPPDEPQFMLNITLLNGEDNTEMVAFSYPFTELEEMYNFNLYLVYEAMANVPITRLGDIEFVEESDRWRNKWLYIRASFDYPVISAYMLKEPTVITGSEYNSPIPLEHSIGVFIGGTVGVELQFLNWMSIEGNFIMRFGEPGNNNTFIPGVGLQLKFPIKPAKHFMIEPYAMGNGMANTSGNHAGSTWYGIGGGVQFGVKGGSMGAFFIDASYSYTFGDIKMKNPQGEGWTPEVILYNRNVISIGIGYKIGLFDRPPRRVRNRDVSE